MKNIIKRGCALFIATMCIMSTFSFSFASGWPSVDEGDTLTATGATNTSTDGSISATETDQTEIQDYAWAEGDISNTINYNTTADSQGDMLATNIYSQYSDTLPDVSIDDLIDWSNKKGFEIIKFLQTFIQPFAIIMFMISEILMLNIKI